MDTIEDTFREPTEDERSARRIVALAIALINARRPITTEYVRTEFYPDMGDEAFRKAYLRDRARLRTAGIEVVRADLPSGETAWGVDEGRSYARDDKLTAADALVLDCLLLPIASDPTFPYANDLRLALTKIDRSFVGDTAVPIPPEARVRNRQLGMMEACITARHAARVLYERADGTRTERTIVPMGLFPLRETTYVVAARLSEGGLEEPHVYNMERMYSVQELKRQTYPLPAGFNVRDYVKLPFQLGETLYEATFEIPDNRRNELGDELGSRVIQTGAEGRHVACLPVADEEVAGAWAIAKGLRPLEPDSLVASWRNRLQATAEED